MKKFIMILLVSISLLGCSTKTEDTIRIGSKGFTENLIMSEIYALALEDNGYKVDRNFNLASSLIHSALVNDEIDLYPEYTGTGLLTILKLPMETDPQKVYDIVSKEYLDQFDITWLDFSNVNDSQGLVINAGIAKELNITNISDLQRNSHLLRFASQGEFDLRDDGIVGLETVYGKFNWKSSTIYDNSLKYEVLKNDQADVTPAYTTEGQLKNTDLFLVLEDDKLFWPPYNIAPVIRNDVLDDKIKGILNEISQKIDTAIMIDLNARVDIDREEYEDVAKDFYEKMR